MQRLFVTMIMTMSLFALSGVSGFALAQGYPGKEFPPGERPMNPAKQEEMRRLREAQMPMRPVHERMSPEDRRQLRRDIDQHGRELYRGRNHR